MNLGFKNYTNIVNQIVDGYFDEQGNYIPSVGKANLISIYAGYILGDERVFDENLAATDFIDEFVNNADMMLGFENALKDADIFSFGSALCDARELIEIRKGQFVRKTKMDDLITAIIDKVNKFDEKISPDEFKTILEKLKDSKPLDEERIVNEFFTKKEAMERA